MPDNPHLASDTVKKQRVKGRGQHPNSKKAIAGSQWKPGQTGNPQGINRGRPYSDRIEEVATGPAPQKVLDQINKRLGQKVLLPGTTWAMANAWELHISAVMDGQVAAAKEARESVEGKALARMEVTGAEGAPFMESSGDLALLDDDALKARKEAALKIIRAAEKAAKENA